ncbi:MAG: DNA gyrase inhibitor YacG [Phycisphaerae bacterium]|nr:DNA gyrase inhibitor YacG [Phycisphaerae bacterium]NIP54441.1 DNA gyrase inhibitor YacG [Phycisphaerae bacterium]NIS53300.1 DNA gyrase inhibitor YacG [Phycisphaerae bacterium]NIU10826.1 DNA gyrase inhibitor YacG [Phycisphaerae bacterium]NIU58621.1 DNA gyrase inhibitor YacG [Phycisphaerae bacterium]
MEQKCPICHKTIKSKTEEKSEKTKFYPFCSRRCKLVDLGFWLDAGYKISQSEEPGELSDNDRDGPDDKR